MRLDEFDNMDEGAQSREAYRSADQQQRSADRMNPPSPEDTKKRLKTRKMAGPRGPIPEATGDEKFDNMMGKISGSTEPQNFNQAQNDRVQDKATHPDAETINALNKMMYDMHVTMQTANRLMQKLMKGQ